MPSSSMKKLKRGAYCLKGTLSGARATVAFFFGGDEESLYHAPACGADASTTRRMRESTRRNTPTSRNIRR